MSFPYLDPAGFTRRTIMSVSEVNHVENLNPGFLPQAIASESSWINGRLRKRYGNAVDKNSLPLGQTPPALVAAGTNPPAIYLTGRPVLGSLQTTLQILVGGSVGTATFRYTLDGGITYSGSTPTAALVVLGTSGMTAGFPSVPNTYSTDNVYTAATPVPEIVLGWLTTLVTMRMYLKRGVNPQDPVVQMLADSVERVRGEVKEAADSKDGLFDLPVSEDLDSAVTTGGPTGSSQASPYVWQDVQQAYGRAQDASYQGFFVGDNEG